MKKIKSIQLKAALLLMVFSLNIVVGFACSLGLNMGFNTHHHDEEATEVHIHKDGSKHHHEATGHKHSDNDKDNDNCCHDKVVKIFQADKAVPQIAKLVPSFFTTVFITVFYNINVNYPSQVNISNKYFLRNYHPPIADIRIAIQSFQI